MKNKRLIEIVSMPNMGKSHELFCNQHLLLRKARKNGDREVVNNYVISLLKRNNIKFREIDY